MVRLRVAGMPTWDEGGRWSKKRITAAFLVLSLPES
jgi:hypothetical protein